MNTNKKKIILILLILILALGVWRYFTLKKGHVGQSQPLTYREFFGLGGRTTTEGILPGYQSDFNAPDGEGTIGKGGSNVQNPPEGTTGTGSSGVSGTLKPIQSAFGTAPAFNPLSGLFSGGNLGSNRGGSGSASGSGSSGSSASSGSSSGTLGLFDDSTADNTLLCDPRDITVEFTPQEEARLKQLEQQLLQIAPELRSAENAQDEANNYESFKIYDTRITEYKDFCFNTSFASKPKRLPTPFWSDPALDTGSLYTINKGFTYARDSTDPMSYYTIENYFDMNIW